MNYYRRSRNWYYYSNRSSVSSSNIEKISRRAPNTAEYIKNEFFNVDDITFNKIANLYKQLYGKGAYKYMMDTYYDWKFNRVGLSGQTMRRILECVPKFLPDFKKFFILKCEILYFVEALHHKHKKRFTSISEYQILYSEFMKEITNFNQLNLSWFVGKIFTQTEINQFLDVCKYALAQKLALSYKQVYNDLSYIKEKLSGLFSGFYTAKYHVDFIDSTIDLSNIHNYDHTYIDLVCPTYNLDGKYMNYTQEFILSELLAMSFTESIGDVKSSVLDTDFSYFLSKCRDIRNELGEATLNSEFCGQGGTLRIDVILKSPQLLKSRAIISGLKILLYIFSILVLSLLTVKYDLGKFIMQFLIFIIPIAILLFSIIIAEIKNLLFISSELKKYAPR